MKRWAVAAAVVALIYAVPGTAAEGNESAGDRFTIHAAVLTGTGVPQDTPVTILLDRGTGRTWMLFVIDKGPTWVPVPYHPKVPDNAEPPGQ